MHMKKKGVVLLITLFFITAISVLILKNLDDSEKFIDEVSQDVSLTQINITNKNVQDEVIKLVNKYHDNIDELLEISSLGIPFDYGDIKLFIKIEDYEFKDCNLNDVSNTEQLYSKCSTFTTENILYSYEFIEQLKKYKPKDGFKNQKQIEFFLDKYKLSTKDEKIDEVRENLEFLKMPDSETTSIRYLKCSFNIDIDNIKAISEFVFKVGQTKIEDNTFNLILTN